MLSDLEGTGQKFSLDQLMDVRSRTRKAVGLIADQVEVGMVEEDAKAMARDTLSGLGMRRGWHVVGSNPDHHRAKEEVKIIWDMVRDKWFSEGLTGHELYDFAIETTKGFGWRLNLDLSGHRLSDYPHSAHYDGSLADVEFRPNPNLWVLEIAIVDPDRHFGAFYEDLLLEDQSFPQ
jgi:methionyl aminopeptidase